MPTAIVAQRQLDRASPGTAASTAARIAADDEVGDTIAKRLRPSERIEQRSGDGGQHRALRRQAGDAGIGHRLGQHQPRDADAGDQIGPARD